MHLIDHSRFSLSLDTSFTSWTFGFNIIGKTGLDLYFGPLYAGVYWGEGWD